MATVPFALSIHHFVSSVGADAGFAAIIGLAILVLLFFSQARETSALRRRAEDAEDALEHLEMRLNSLARSGAAAAPAASPAVAAPPASARAARPGVTPAPAGAPTAAPAPALAAAGGGGGGVATIPAAPAGVGAPALSSATRLIPLGPGEGISIRPLRDGEGDPAEPGEAARNGNGNGNGNGHANGVAPALDAPPPPSTPAGGARLAPSGGSRPPAVAAAAAGLAPDSRAATGGLPPRPAGLPPRREALPGPRQWRPGRVAIVLAGAVAIIAIVAVLVVVLGSSGSASSSRAARRSTAARTATRHRATPPATTVVPAKVGVAVLNGTSTPNLAHDVMAKLASFGYHQAVTPTTASNQTLTQTVVGYASPADRPDALAVAHSLGLSATVVQAVSSSDRTVACTSSPTSCPAQVFVTVGSDLATLG